MPSQRPPDLDATGQPAGMRPPDLDAQGQPLSDDLGNPVFRSSTADPATTQAGIGASNPGLEWIDSVVDFGKGVWRNVNPVTAAKAIGGAISDPLGTGQAIGEAQGAEAIKAQDAFKKGDYVTGARHLLAYAIPLLGPALSGASDTMMEGRTAEGLGEATGIGLGAFGPQALLGTRVRVPAITRTNPKEAAAIQFAERRGIPLDAGTATGRPIVKGLQKRAADSMGGAGTADVLREGQAVNLTRVGNELAGQANASRLGRPGAPMDAVRAGEAVNKRLESRINAQARVADRAYAELRAKEAASAQTIARTGGVQAPGTAAAPFTNVPLAVDVAAAKASLKPIYDGLLREAELNVPMQGGKGRALVALDGLMKGPDLAPLSAVDAALGDLKSMARTGDLPALRTQGQGIAAEAVKALDAHVQATARAAGPDVYAALMRGRSATVGKYQTAGVREMLADEPAQIARQLTANKDMGLDRLKAVAKEAPRELPKVGRAYLEDMLSRATAEGGFGHADALFAEWQRLGPETKQLLFRDKAYIKDLDNFFLVAKRIAENPNPSGTARVLTGTNLLASIPLYAASKLFHTRQGVNLLTRGVSLPVGNKAASAAWQSEMANLIGRETLAPPVPAGAEDR